MDVVVSELLSAATRLQNDGRRLRAGLSGVDLEVGQLLGSGWKGAAASAYATAWEQWRGGAERVVQGLQRMSESLSETGKAYAETDERGAATIGSTRPWADGSSEGP